MLKLIDYQNYQFSQLNISVSEIISSSKNLSGIWITNSN